MADAEPHCEADTTSPFLLKQQTPPVLPEPDSDSTSNRTRTQQQGTTPSIPFAAIIVGMAEKDAAEKNAAEKEEAEAVVVEEEVVEVGGARNIAEKDGEVDAEGSTTEGAKLDSSSSAESSSCAEEGQTEKDQRSVDAKAFKNMLKQFADYKDPDTWSQVLNPNNKLYNPQLATLHKAIQWATQKTKPSKAERQAMKLAGGAAGASTSLEAGGASAASSSSSSASASAAEDGSGAAAGLPEGVVAGIGISSGAGHGQQHWGGGNKGRNSGYYGNNFGYNYSFQQHQLSAKGVGRGAGYGYGYGHGQPHREGAPNIPSELGGPGMKGKGRGKGGRGIGNGWWHRANDGTHEYENRIAQRQLNAIAGADSGAESQNKEANRRRASLHRADGGHNSISNISPHQAADQNKPLSLVSPHEGLTGEESCHTLAYAGHHGASLTEAAFFHQQHQQMMMGAAAHHASMMMSAAALHQAQVAGSGSGNSLRHDATGVVDPIPIAASWMAASSFPPMLAADPWSAAPWSVDPWSAAAAQAGKNVFPEFELMAVQEMGAEKQKEMDVGGAGLPLMNRGSW